MSEETDFTAPADDMAGDTQSTDEDQIWAELAAEEGTPAADEAAEDADTDDEEPPAEEAEKADDAADTPDDDTPDEDGTGEEDDGAPDDDAEPPTAAELRERAEKLEQKFRSEQSRSIAQQKRADRLQKELDALKRRQRTTGDTDEETDKSLDALSQEYGDVVGPLVDQVKDLKSRQKDLSNLEKQRLETIEGELADIQAVETAKFEEAHSDGMDVIAQNAGVFRDWIEDQPKIVRDAFQANLNGITDGTGAAMVVSRFKAAISEAAAGAETKAEDPPQTDTRLASRRRRQLDGAKATRSTSSQKAAGDIPPDTDDEEALWKYWAGKDAKS